MLRRHGQQMFVNGGHVRFSSLARDSQSEGVRDARDNWVGSTSAARPWRRDPGNHLSGFSRLPTIDHGPDVVPRFLSAAVLGSPAFGRMPCELEHSLEIHAPAELVWGVTVDVGATKTGENTSPVSSGWRQAQSAWGARHRIRRPRSCRRMCGALRPRLRHHDAFCVWEFQNAQHTVSRRAQLIDSHRSMAAPAG